MAGGCPAVLGDTCRESCTDKLKRNANLRCNANGKRAWGVWRHKCTGAVDLQAPAAVVAESGFHGIEEIERGELMVGEATWPVGFQAEMLAILEPEGDLFDGGLLEVVGKRGLAWGGRGAGEDVAAGVGDAGQG